MVLPGGAGADEVDADGPIGEAYFGSEGDEWIAVTPHRVRNGRHDDAVVHVAKILSGRDVRSR